jgi:hypothetical protein
VKKNIKKYFILMAGAILLYSSLMILIRLKITELGYEFEETKAYERALREEQLVLRADLANRLSVRGLKKRWEAKGFAEPEPKQIVVIP